MRNLIGVGAMVSFGLVSSAYAYTVEDNYKGCGGKKSCIKLDLDNPEDQASVLVIVALIIVMMAENFLFGKWKKRQLAQNKPATLKSLFGLKE